MNTDKIKDLPDDFKLFIRTAEGSKFAPFSIADLKNLVASHEWMRQREELLNLIDVDEDGIFNVHRDGKLIGYGPTVKDAIDSATGFDIAQTALKGEE